MRDLGFPDMKILMFIHCREKEVEIQYYFPINFKIPC